MRTLTLEISVPYKLASQAWDIVKLFQRVAATFGGSAHMTKWQ